MSFAWKALATLAVAIASRSAFAQSIIGNQDTMTISNINAGPDGFTRPVIAVNGEFPSPLVRANKGDDFRINVVNNLDDDTMLRQTSVHWHGVFQHQSAWADGPDGVTQCPIPQSGQEFEYAFNAGQEAGTFWYHSHYGTQYCDGLRGPLVIYDPEDPHQDLYDVDDENTIITLADWYHLQAPSIQGPAVSQATLINGKGRRPGSTEGDIAVVNVEKDSRYRFRIVSLSCDPDYTFSIDNHTMTIIEADGQNTKPLEVESIRVFAGQRYSVVVNADQAIGNYWIRAEPNIGDTGLVGTSGGGVNSAILRYATADEVEPDTPRLTNRPALQESNLRALTSGVPGGDGPADITFTFNLGLNFATGTFSMNPGESWVHPDTPVMVQIMNGVPAEDLVPAESLHTITRGQVVEVVIPPFGIAGPHPFHLHGHAFSVIKSAGGSPNFVDPVRRDVVAVGTEAGQGDTIIRFVADNPGPWFFHCHIEFHLVTGLAAVFMEAPDEIASSNPPPPSWDALCPAFSALPPSATSIRIVPTPTP
ncbi:laccase 5 [Coprinopsis cinerea AmutBmut pab1-1]|uniref:Laccase 5 n=1 Tax=Coprinopsis cinerea TaxID=5346 RepID=Q6VMB9_COPCI|nr:laccase 5 [Coprinopsis cinerea]KAG2022525.1 laccase 5 [Coprinopsis cinerea AmutBmut pab1-1]